MNRREFLLATTAAVVVAGVAPGGKTLAEAMGPVSDPADLRCYEYVTIDLNQTPMEVRLRPIFDALWDGDFDRALYRFDELWAEETKFGDALLRAMRHTKRVPVDDFFNMRRDAYPRELRVWNNGKKLLTS